MPESTQHKLDRVRSPRVQITYDVETGGAIVKRELPLVVGVLAGLSGDTVLPNALKDRKFVEIDRDNFDSVLEKAAPSLNACTIDGRSRAFVPPLAFTSLDSFSPFQIVQKVATLKALFQSRSLLADLVAKLDGNETLEKRLKDLAKTPDQLRFISEEEK
jgi:type VI secretion system protein ImpB